MFYAVCCLFVCVPGQLSCKLEREFRCVELAEMMTHSVVTLAIRYASRSRRMALAQRLSELALEKANQLQEEEQEEDDEPAYQRLARKSGCYIYFNYNSYSSTPGN